MAEEQDTDRWKYIRGLHFEYADFYDLFGTAVVAIFVILFIRAIFPPDGSDFDMNLTTEVIGIVITIFVIDRRNGRRELRRYQQQLIDEAASTSNSTAKHAVHVMRRRGWLVGSNGILCGVNLEGADLEAAMLENANLRNVKLNGANLIKARLSHATILGASLQSTRLSGAVLFETQLSDSDLGGVSLDSAILTRCNMQRSNLSHALLERANLMYANLQEAMLESASFVNALLQNANLQRATLIGTSLANAYLVNVDFEGANLRGANLQGSNLTGANLRNAIFSIRTDFDESTILPDGTKWYPTVDWSRFTDPAHEDRFRSTDSESPAYSKEFSITVFSEE